MAGLLSVLYSLENLERGFVFTKWENFWMRGAQGCVPLDGESSRVAGLSQCTPHFLFGLAEKKTGRARSKEKNALVATLHMRAKLLYGGRREMVPAGSRWLPDGRGVVRCGLDG